ncbi:MAG: hypothetical protein LUQ38_09350, partial [Methanotrichaceae archaeon]|nr:hypothetical protein [Methanotrichaceae archaeon]
MTGSLLSMQDIIDRYTWAGTQNVRQCSPSSGCSCRRGSRCGNSVELYQLQALAQVLPDERYNSSKAAFITRIVGSVSTRKPASCSRLLAPPGRSCFPPRSPGNRDAPAR